MRNFFYVLSLSVSLLSIAPLAHANEWRFIAKIDGKPMGEHSFKLTENEGTNTLLSEAKFNVKVLFINAYKYQHTAKETWRNDCLQSLSANTNENKVITKINGKQDGQQFLLDSAKGPQNLGECVMTFAYWNPKMLTQKKLLNPQNGDWLDVQIKSLGNETLTVKGKPIETEHYSLNASKMKIELWFATNVQGAKDWVALKSTTPEGYVVTYELK